MELELGVDDVALRLLLAAGLGALIGIEREARGHPAGFRTLSLISLASALVMILSLRVGSLNAMADPGRIAAHLLAGVGFIGGGVILRSGMNVHGITTAATIWAVAALGLVVGAGYVTDALIATAIIAATLLVFPPIENRLLRSSGRDVLRIEAEPRPELIEELRRTLVRHGYRVEELSMTGREASVWRFRLVIRGTSQGRQIDPLPLVLAVDGVRGIEVLERGNGNGSGNGSDLIER